MWQALSLCAEVMGKENSIHPFDRTGSGEHPFDLTTPAHREQGGGALVAVKPDPETKPPLKERLYQSLFVDSVLQLPRLRKWFRTIRDERFYSARHGLPFDLVERYFEERGWDRSKGMTIKPARKILSRFREVHGVLHPRETIYVVAPGDPIFQGVDSTGGGRGSKKRDPSTAGSYAPDAVTSSRSKYINLPAPRIILTSRRILNRREAGGSIEWESHFYSDVKAEAPTILSCSTEAGWHRALEQEEGGYWSQVRYIDSQRNRHVIECVDTNTASLVSYLIRALLVRRTNRSWLNYLKRNRRVKFDSSIQRATSDHHLLVPEALNSTIELAEKAETFAMELPELDEEANQHGENKEQAA